MIFTIKTHVRSTSKAILIPNSYLLFVRKQYSRPKTPLTHPPEPTVRFVARRSSAHLAFERTRGLPFLVCRPVRSRRKTRGIRVSGVRGISGRVASAEKVTKSVAEQRADDSRDRQQNNAADHDGSACGYGCAVTVGDQRKLFA